MKTQTIKPASPLPWFNYAHMMDGEWTIGSKEPTLHCVASSIRLANAAYIVHACNNFPALVEALEKIADATDPDGSQCKMLCELYEVARAALAAAKGAA